VRTYSSGIRHDYRQGTDAAAAPRRPTWLWFLLGLLPPLLLIGIWLAADSPEQAVARVAQAEIPAAMPAAGSLTLPLPIPGVDTTAPEVKPQPVASADPLPEETAELALTVGRGESLDILFRRQKLSIGDLAQIVRLEKAKKPLTFLRPGDEIRISHRDGRILRLERELNEVNVLQVEHHDDGFHATIVAREVEARTVSAHASIDRSLFEAGQAAGISDAVTMNMAGIFQWDIDFVQDVRVGDEFSVLYEELWRDGEKLRDGEIVAAEFINQGNTYRAVRYIDGDGRSDYFTPDGRSVRKAFIRAPVDFTRISSAFNPNRRHPILNSIRAHRGVDYAAPRGTPVKAAGDGKVIFRGVKGGYGRAVILQHGSNITTLYAHLDKFAAKSRNGRRVKQGEIIGYVGASGLATAPHLHYEYRVNGVHRNPRTVKLPPAEPVKPQYRDDFQMAAAPVWEQLELYGRTRLAAGAL
jgi:murein DD-endopeptidase MepM/ murein hydrolase activator NlpD